MNLWTHFWHYCSKNPDKVATILFYVGTMSLAVFTYNQAKKQLFFPMRTETYRLTVKLLTEVQDYFVGFDTHELSKRLGLIDLAAVNLSFMLDLYANIVLHISPPETLQVWKHTTKKYMSFNPIALSMIAYRTPGLHLNLFEFRHEDYQQIIRSKPEWMEKYQHFIIFAPDSYEAALSKAHSFLSSPFLPKELVLPLQSLRDELVKQREDVRTALDKMADDVGNEITTEADFLSKADTFYPKIIRVLQDLSPKSKAISDAIRHYMNVDDLFKN